MTKCNCDVLSGPVRVASSAMLLIMVLSSLGGCATASNPLPKCDGYSRRPLNRTVRQWEKFNGQARRSQQTGPGALKLGAAFLEDEGDRRPAAMARFDEDASYRPCTGK